MKTLHLAKGLDLPLETAVTQKYCFAGRSGSGKTYGATKLAELMLDAGAQVVVIDLVGVWYGLRVGADGGEGIPVPVLGGQHGDVELDEHGGAIVADLVVDQGLSVVLDVSSLETDTSMRRFVRAFVERFYDRKKQARSPVHIFFEEAQELVPQKASGEISHLVNAMQRLIKIGRNFGIGVTLITQRPQAVSKEVLNQTEAVFVGQMNGKHERDAMEDWIVAQDGDTKLVEELPSLEVGTMFVWSPQWLKRFDKVKIAKKRTADVSRTLGFSDGKKVESRKLAPVDLAKLGAAMTKAVEEKKASDPAAMRKRIADLEKQLLAKGPPAKVERVVEKVPVLGIEEMHGLERTVEAARPVIENLVLAFRVVAEKLELVRRDAGLADAQPVPAPAISIQRPTRPVEKRAAREKPHVPISIQTADDGLKRGAREMLAALRRMHPRRLTRSELAVVAGLSQSGTFTDYMSAIRTRGLIDEADRTIGLTAAGLEVAGPPRGRPTTEHLVALWMPKFKAGARRILEVAVRHPDGLTRSRLAELADLAQSGTFTDYLSSVYSAGLLDKRSDGTIGPSAALFIGER